MIITVISGGVGQPSSTRLLADRLADATRRRVHRSVADRNTADRNAVELRTVELRGLAVPIAQAMVSNHRTVELTDAIAAVLAADAVILVAPVFNAAPSGLVISFLDLLEPDALAGVPVLLGATGGTARHSQAVPHGLGALLGYLRALVLPTTVFLSTGDWGATGDRGTTGGPQDRIERAGAELAALLVSGPGRRVAADPYDDIVDFETQLTRVRDAG